jgi:serine/threonine protein kinase
MPGTASVVARASTGVDRARAKHDQMQNLLDRFGGALGLLDAVLAAGSKLPLGIGSACQFLRGCFGVLGTMSDVTQDVLDFGEMLIEAAEHLRSIAEVAERIEGAAADQLKRLLETVAALIKDCGEALGKFGKRGFVKAMLKAVRSATTFGKLAQRMKDTFQQVQTTLVTAQLSLTLDMVQRAFATEAAVAKQVEAVLAQHGGDAAKAADAVAKDEGAMAAIKAEAGLGETLFRAEMDALREDAEARHAEQMGALATAQLEIRKLGFRNLSKLTDSYEFCDAQGGPCKKKLALLGKGAFGATYRMRHKIDGGLFAVKMVVIVDVEGAGVDLEAMQRESQAMTRLCHTNIIRFWATCMWEHEVDDEEVKEYCMVMELAPGGTLAALIAKKEPLPEKDIKKLLLQLCSALEHMHAVGMLHRDLKPANILLSARGDAKICDLGLACVVLTGASSGLSKGTGTLAYMSPEKGTGKKYNEKDDIWALGCILFELVTLMTTGSLSPAGLFNALQKIELEVVGAVDAVYPRFGDFVRAMLAPAAADRPSAADLVRMLRDDGGTEELQQRLAQMEQEAAAKSEQFMAPPPPQTRPAAEAQQSPAALPRPPRQEHWEDTEACQSCSTPFSLTNRRHHCRQCGNCVCAGCSPRVAGVQTYPGLQRVCETCVARARAWLVFSETSGDAIITEAGRMAVKPKGTSYAKLATPQWNGGDITLQLAGTINSVFVGLCAARKRVSATDKPIHSDSDVWMISCGDGCLHGHGVWASDRPGPMPPGARLTLRYDPSKGTLLFVVNGRPHGPGFKGVGGSVKICVEMYMKGAAVRL